MNGCFSCTSKRAETNSFSNRLPLPRHQEKMDMHIHIKHIGPDIQHSVTDNSTHNRKQNHAQKIKRGLTASDIDFHRSPPALPTAATPFTSGWSFLNSCLNSFLFQQHPSSRQAHPSPKKRTKKHRNARKITK
jgi:hypothetical protein